jgi:hypothetical protein
LTSYRSDGDGVTVDDVVRQTVAVNAVGPAEFSIGVGGQQPFASKSTTLHVDNVRCDLQP